MSELPPQQFDRFEVSRVLGRGGMGTVYLARDARLDRLVAIKVLNVQDLAAEDRRVKFLREARTAASIRHPNVATIYEVAETDDGIPFIVMEFCEGETLSQRLRRRPLDAAGFLSIARQIAAGVAAAHDAGVAHRDLKPGNIIIEPTGQVKILDFGLAKSLLRDPSKSFDSSTSRKLFGTLHYLSPEQARGLPADARSDLFSTGVIFYQMATGQLPFNAEAPLAVIEKICDAEPEPFVPSDPAFPPTAAKIIGKLLKKDPDHRYQSARDLLSDLEEIDTPTMRMSAAQTRSMIGRTIARQPRWGLLALILVAFLGGGAAIWWLSQRERPLPESPGTPPPPIRSMAVMPLENISSSTRDEFLSVGLADALVTKLQKIPSLQVRPTSAVMEFKNKKVDSRTASDHLRVDGVLEGHFLSAGDLVRVNLQLTDGRTGYSVWADTVDGNRADLLKLIDDVSSRTVKGLNEKLGVQGLVRGSVPRSANPKAYEEYLKARAIDGSLVHAEHDEQIEHLKRAIALDPNFPAAYADLAIAMHLGQSRGLARAGDTPERAEWYARQAVRLDPNLPDAHLALGRAFVRFPDRFTESVRENLAALRLDPSATIALNTISTYFISQGDTQKAQCVMTHLTQIDPASNEVKTRGYNFVNAVDPEDALKAADDALASRETALAGHDIRANAFLMMGDVAAAQQEAQQAAALAPNHYIGKSLKAMIAAANGDRAAAEAALKSFEADAERVHWAAMRQALCFAKLGDRDTAMKWVRRAAEGGNHSWFAWVKHPWLEPLQSDPEYQTIVAKMKADLDDVRDDVIGVYQLICR
ncbi:MAG TPA: protein kinase [Thermoanaerobaculia bacterium]|jgi:serine/threonine-protein kinase